MNEHKPGRPWFPLLLLFCAAACDTAADTPAPEDPVPQGVQDAIVQQLDDGCALLQPELQEGHRLSVFVERLGADVRVSFPGTTLPRLLSTGHDRDRFQTAARTTPISAQDGRCTAQRAQHYEGLRQSASEYDLLFHNEDSQPMGACGPTPIPCTTVAVLGIRACYPRSACGTPGPGQ